MSKVSRAKKTKRRLTDKGATLDDIKALVRKFVADRDWTQFHSPKNLSMCIAVEASELMEIFQWAGTRESHAILEKRRSDIEGEAADVFIALLAFCDLHGIDLAGAVSRKMKKNIKKYPVKLVKGKNKKYNEY